MWSQQGRKQAYLVGKCVNGVVAKGGNGRGCHWIMGAWSPRDAVYGGVPVDETCDSVGHGAQGVSPAERRRLEAEGALKTPEQRLQDELAKVSVHEVISRVLFANPYCVCC